MDEKRKRAVIADDDEDAEDVVVPGTVDDDAEKGITPDVEEEQENEPENDDEGDGMDDLFGDEDDEGPTNADSIPPDDDGLVHDSDDEDVDQFLVHAEEEPRELRIGELDVVRHPPKFNGNEGEIYTANVPKFIQVNPTRFDGTDHIKQLEQLIQSGISKEQIDLKRLQDENTVRWRFTKQSNESLTAESNAQIVEWEDGTLSLKLGDEYFDVLQSSIDDTFLVTTDDATKSSESKPTIYIADGAITKTIKFVPTSTNSKIHKKLTTAIRSQQTKSTTQSVVVEVDPSLEAKRLEKEQEDRLREKRRQQLKLEKDQERLGSVSNGSQGRDRYSQREPYYPRSTDDYEQDDFIDDEDEGEDAGDDEDVMEDVAEDDDEDNDDDDDDLAAERLRRVKAEGASKYQEADSEEPQARKKRRVIDDDEDDE